MERGAAERIHYADEAYTRFGVELTERTEALGADRHSGLPSGPRHRRRPPSQTRGACSSHSFTTTSTTSRYWASCSNATS